MQRTKLSTENKESDSQSHTRGGLFFTQADMALQSWNRIPVYFCVFAHLFVRETENLNQHVKFAHFFKVGISYRRLKHFVAKRSTSVIGSDLRSMRL